MNGNPARLHRAAPRAPRSLPRYASAVPTSALTTQAYLFSGGGEVWSEPVESAPPEGCPFPRRAEANRCIERLAAEIAEGEWSPMSATQVAERVAGELSLGQLKPGDPRMKIARAIPLTALMTLHGRYVFDEGEGEAVRFRHLNGGQIGPAQPYKALGLAIATAFAAGWDQLVSSGHGAGVRQLLEINEQFLAPHFDPSSRQTSGSIREEGLKWGVEAGSEIPAFALTVGVGLANLCARRGLPPDRAALASQSVEPLQVANDLQAKLVTSRLGLPLTLAFRDRLHTILRDYGRIEVTGEGNEPFQFEDHGELQRHRAGDPGQPVPLLVCLAHLARANPDDRLSVVEKTIAAGTRAIEHSGLFAPEPALATWQAIEARRQLLADEMAARRRDSIRPNRSEGELRRELETLTWERMGDVVHTG
jgi:hypothetical protein